MAKKKGKSAFHNEFLEVYTHLYKRFYDHEPNFGNVYTARSHINGLLGEFTEKQVLAMLFLHFEWYGPNGNDERASHVLINNHFPVTWIQSRSVYYSAYLQKVLGSSVWYDDSELKRYIDTWERTLFSEKND